ncbi:Ig-like domain-containing protein [Candidatus Palauibacter sp.]|uniref:Ig-like domain-containing protein n=1 Tax=Candidatus Palauibacter sp. TaxID=3101350 RepID=UPI003AF2FFD4
MKGSNHGACATSRTGRVERFTTRSLWVLAVGMVVSYCTDTLGPDERHPSSARLQRTATPSLVISPDSVVLTSLLEEWQLEATFTDEQGNETTPAVAWFSVDTLVASVDSTGLVTGLANGATFIEATHSGYTDSARVVVEQQADRLEIVADALFFLRTNEYREIRADIFDAAGSPMDGEVTWSSSDNRVVRAPTRCGGTRGLEFPCARSVSEGQAVLIGTHDAVADTIPLTVAVARSIRVTNGTFYTFDSVGSEFRIEAEVRGSGRRLIANAPIRYESSSPEVAAVDSTGLVEVVGYGATLIRLRAGRPSATVWISVLSQTTDIRVAPPTTRLYAPGDTARVDVLATTASGQEHSIVAALFQTSGELTWSIADPTIAEIDATGLVTAKDQGETEIVATYTEYWQEEEHVHADTARVVVRYVDHVEVQPNPVRISTIGDTVRMHVRALYEGQAVEGDVYPVWSSDIPEVATVDSTGLVTAIAVGSTPIRAALGPSTGLALVHVVPPSAPSNVSFARTPRSEVKEGDNLTVMISADTAPKEDTEILIDVSFPDRTPDFDFSGATATGPGTYRITTTLLAGRTSREIDIRGVDDDVIEPTRDSVFFTLQPTEHYGVASPSADTAIVFEGVCDRAEPVMSQILFWARYRKFRGILEPDLDRCWELDDESLNGIRRMRLFGPTASADGAVRVDTIPMMTLEELQGSGLLQNLSSRADLEKLDLQRADFSGLTGLIDLWIINYDLTDVSWEDELFAELPVLEQLIFQNSKMSDIPATMFRGINTGGGSSAPTCPERTLYRTLETEEPYCYMVSLLFGEVEFTGTLSADLLDPLEGVRAVEFGRMEMETIPSGFFDDLPDLGNVSLVGLPLTAIDADLFANNPGLFQLNMVEVLNENSLALPAGFLDSQTDLLKVNLRANGLTTIDSVFADGTTIQELYFDSNELSALPAGFLGRVTPELRLLDLTRNQFERIPDGFFEGLQQPISRLLLHGNPGPDRDTLTNDFSISASIAEREVETGRSMKLAVNIPAGSPVDVPFEVFVSSGYVGTVVDSQHVLSTELVVRAGRTVTDSITITRLDTIPFATTCATFTEPDTDPCWTSPSTAPNSKAEVVVRSRGGAVDVSGLTLNAEFDPMALFTTDDPSMPFLRKPLPVIRVLKNGSYRLSALHPDGQVFRNPNHLGEVILYLNEFVGRTATSTDLGPDLDLVGISVDPFEEHTTFGSLTNPVLGISPAPGVGRKMIADTTYAIDFNVYPPTEDTTITTETRWVDRCDEGALYADSVSVPTPISRVCGWLIIRPQHWAPGTYDVGIDAIEYSTGELLSTTITIEVLEKDPTKFNLDIVDVNGAVLTNAKMKTAIDYAVRRWGEVLEDVRDVRADVGRNVPLKFGCQTVEYPPVYVTAIDDMLVWVDAFHDDGPGGTLAAATVCAVRDATDAQVGIRREGYGIPVIGWFYFDLDDVDRLTQDRLNAVVLHELGHTLGLGIASTAAGTWYQQGECADPNSRRGRCYDQFHRSPHAPGPTAIRAFDAANGKDTEGRDLVFRRKVPLEPGGRSGSSGGHWEEDVLDYELMTPYVNMRADGTIPFSAITAGFMVDMGYSLQGTLSTSWPDQYCIPDIDPFDGTLPCIDPSGDAPFTNLPMEERIRRGLVIDLTHDVVVGPVKAIDVNGRITGIFYPRNPIPFSTARRLQQLDLDDPNR